VKQRLDTVAHDKGCPANLQALRQALVGYAAARDGDFAATRATWQGLDWNSLEVTLPLLEQLDQFASDALAQKSTVEAPESTMENWNLLETEILAQLQRIPSWADNPRTWQLTARIHQRRGERAEALRIYNRLLEKLPRDLALRREMATLLDTATTDAERQASIQNWQAFVQASDEGSVDWYDGHFGLIQAMLRAGQRDDAEKKFAELRAAHPELGGAPSAARLRQLLEEGR
jgi:predicted Zn-dependent protease